MYAVLGAILFEQLESTNESAENYETFLNELWDIANETNNKEGIIFRLLCFTHSH